MKRNMILCALCVGMFVLLASGCAKKQVVRPSPEYVPPPPTAETEEPEEQEPQIRFTDWQPAAELGTIYFAFDSTDLIETARTTLKANAQYLLANPDLNVLVEGYCDERGTVEYNLALGQRRASIVREYYGQLGVPAGRIGTLSYGEEKPASSGHTEAAWSQNRRAETKVRTRRETKSTKQTSGDEE